MKKILFGDKKKNFKGNMHCHSTFSDGKMTPEELKAYYKGNGYSFLAITDHEHINNNSYLDDEDFITITSCELAIKEIPEQSTLKNYCMKVCHLNLYAKKQDNDYNACYDEIYDHFSAVERRASFKRPKEDFGRVYGKDGINRIIKTANENGFFVVYNHPRWSLENYREYSGYEGLWGVEIYNTACNNSGLYEYNINVVDDMLRDGKRVYCSSGDDNHNIYSDSFGTFVMVNADSLTYDNIIASLLNGNFYTSTGPEIYEISVDGLSVKVKCSDVKRINLSTKGRRADSVIAKGDSFINEAQFTLNESDGYFRLSLIDEKGNRADSQSFFLEDLI